MKTLAGKTVLGPRSSKGKNKPPSVSAQFNVSYFITRGYC